MIDINAQNSPLEAYQPKSQVSQPDRLSDADIATQAELVFGAKAADKLGHMVKQEGGPINAYTASGVNDAASAPEAEGEWGLSPNDSAHIIDPNDPDQIVDRRIRLFDRLTRSAVPKSFMSQPAGGFEESPQRRAKRERKAAINTARILGDLSPVKSSDHVVGKYQG